MKLRFVWAIWAVAFIGSLAYLVESDESKAQNPFSSGPSLTGGNTWSGTNVFGTVVGTVTTQSGTTYTLLPTDCGTTIRFTANSAVLVTIPATLTVACVISIAQLGAAKVSVNGSAATPATLHSAHAYTGTSGQYAIISVWIDATSDAILTGDGA